LLNVLDDIISQGNDGFCTVLILLDLSKAFDTVDHSLLTAKLHYYGFDDNSVSFFNSYLVNREQIVGVDDLYSNRVTISSGVPQGSVLGPLLFLIYTSDMFNVVSFCNVMGFADDTQIYHSFKYDDINDALT